jgi:hypothetical protein
LGIATVRELDVPLLLKTIYEFLDVYIKPRSPLIQLSN